ncbi:MAG: COX15/CtaA family protein [Acidimicrobiia bacterium]
MSGIARAAWGVLAWNVLTIVGGALVSATGSGAGCGPNWPSCNGELLPGFDQTETIIEFSHRAVSGIALIAVLGLWWAVRRRYASGTPERRFAFWSVVAILGEAAIGAWLVLAELVAEDDSVARAISVPLHLVNTLLLLGVLTLLAWRLTTGRSIAWQGPHRRHLVIGAIGLLVLGATGSITSLAGYLFPAESLAEGIAADLSAEHFLTTLRVVHPFVAVGATWYLIWFANRVSRETTTARLVSNLVVAQFAVGVLNIVFLDALWLALVHLLLADLLWIAWVVLGADLLTAEKRSTVEA